MNFSDYLINEDYWLEEIYREAAERDKLKETDKENDKEDDVDKEEDQ